MKCEGCRRTLTCHLNKSEEGRALPCEGSPPPEFVQASAPGASHGEE